MLAEQAFIDLECGKHQDSEELYSSNSNFNELTIDLLSAIDFLMSDSTLSPRFNSLLFSAITSLLQSNNELTLPVDCYNTCAKYFVQFKGVIDFNFPFLSIILFEELKSKRVSKYLEPEVFHSIATM